MNFIGRGHGYAYEEASAIDVYYDMDIAQICQHFNKSKYTVDKAIAKLVKDNPDKDWKYKNSYSSYHNQGRRR